MSSAQPPTMLDAYLAVSKVMNKIKYESYRADVWKVETSLNPFSKDLSRIQTPVAISDSKDLNNYTKIVMYVDSQSVGTIGNIDIQKLKSLARPSPFGRGNQTVFDESVRKAL